MEHEHRLLHFQISIEHKVEPQVPAEPEKPKDIEPKKVDEKSAEKVEEVKKKIEKVPATEIPAKVPQIEHKEEPRAPAEAKEPKKVEERPAEAEEQRNSTPAQITFEQFKDGVRFGPYMVKAINDGLIVNGRRWKLKGKEGKAKMATLTVKNAEWTHPNLSVTVQGTAFMLSEEETQSMNEQQALAFLRQLSASTSPLKLKKRDNSYSGVDLVPA